MWDDKPQYHTTFFIFAAEKSVYRLGMLENRLCAGRLIDPWIVPPYPRREDVSDYGLKYT
jgi:hypothetical protein